MIKVYDKQHNMPRATIRDININAITDWVYISAYSSHLKGTISAQVT